MRAFLDPRVKLARALEHTMLDIDLVGRILRESDVELREDAVLQPLLHFELIEEVAAPVAGKRRTMSITWWLSRKRVRSGAAAGPASASSSFAPVSLAHCSMNRGVALVISKRLVNADASEADEVLTVISSSPVRPVAL